MNKNSVCVCCDPDEKSFSVKRMVTSARFWFSFIFVHMLFEIVWHLLVEGFIGGH